MTFPLSSPNPGTTQNPAFHTYLFEWNDRSVDENGFQLWARSGTTGDFVSLGNIAPESTLVTTNLNVFPAGTTLQFQVRAFKGAPTPNEFSAYSNIATVVVPASPDFAPPSSLSATNVSRDGLRLTWADNSEQEEFYVVEFKRSTATADQWEFYALPYFNSTRFVLGPNLDPGGTYDFRVRGLRVAEGTFLGINPATKRLAHQTGSAAPFTYSEGRLRYTNPAVVSGVVIPALSSPPSRLTGVAVDEDTIRLNWFDESDKEETYALAYRLLTNPPSGTFQRIFSSSNATGLEISSPPGTAYEWEVLAAYELPNTNLLVSSASNRITLATPFHAPTGFTASVLADSDTITFSWTDRSLVENGYELVGRLVGTTPFLSASTVAANVTTTTFTGLNPGASYEFAVRAFHNSGPESGLSNIVTVTARNRVTSRSYQAIAPGQPFLYQASATAQPSAATWEAFGLPDGLVMNASTGQITGTATSYGVFPVTLRATYTDGSVSESSLVLRSVRPAAAPLSLTAGTRTIQPSVQRSIALDTLFSDPDTEKAVRLTTSEGVIDIILYSTATPQTVANFMGYVTGGYYDGVAFHRVFQGGPIDIVQGGAFKPDTAGGADRFTSVPVLNSVPNEPGVSNRIGTIAMAKIGGQPDSATHDFFFNRVDSNSPTDPNALDTQESGFTAFGRVAGTGMQVVDQIAALKQGAYNIRLDGSESPAGPYPGWPVTVDPAPTEMDNTRVVVVQTASEVPALSFQVTGNTNPGEVMAELDGTGRNLLVSGLTSGEQAEITVSATDLDGNAVSQTFMVQVLAGAGAPAITGEPQDRSAAAGDQVELTVVAGGDAPLTYVWRKGGVAVPGGTGATLVLDPVAYRDRGTYVVEVRNAAGSAFSREVSLAVSSPPVLVRQPGSVTRATGSLAWFSVNVEGVGPFTYQWFKGPSLIPGAVARTLTLERVTKADEASYSVRVSNANGFTNSDPAVLTVIPLDTDGDGIFDHQELAANTDPTKPDTDGDGYDDAAEQAFGTNPRSPRSRPDGHFVARKDGLPILAGLSWKRVPGTAQGTTYNHSVDGAEKEVPPFWLTEHEMTNGQFAGVLFFAHELMEVTTITPLVGGRREVTYQGQRVCLLATHLSTEASSFGVNEVDHHPEAGFFVPQEVANQPVRGVTWHGAYLASLVFNALVGYEGKSVPATWTFDPNLNGATLPSDLQWEWAARAGTANRAFPTGTGVSAAVANFLPSGFGKPRRVGRYPSNPFGLFDLAGNVAEWVHDGPVATPADSYIRGGAWDDSADALSTTAREALAKSSTGPSVGIRLALQDERAPSFATQPASQIVIRGQPLVLGAPAVGPALTGQWFRNGTNLPGQSGPVLSIPSAQGTDAGSYRVVISNARGSLSSSPARVAVLEVPVATQKRFVPPGVPLTLNIPYSGSGLAFAWTKDGTALADDASHDMVNPTSFRATASLTIRNPGKNSSGIYRCAVSQVAESSQPVTVAFDVSVAAPPLFFQNAPATILNAGFSYNLAQDGHSLRRATSYTIFGLPPGFAFNSATGRITGRPTTAGVYTIFVIAFNPAGSDSQTFALTVQSLNPSTVGTFTGLVARHPGLNGQLGGSVSLTTTKSGACSGRLNLGGQVFRLQGNLNASVNTTPGSRSGGNATFRRDISRSGGLPPVRLDLTLNASTKLVTGSVTEWPAVGTPPASPAPPSSIAAIQGWRLQWSPSSRPVGRMGLHNVALDIPTALEGQVGIPQGYGFGAIVVPDTGMVTVTGRLADGIPFTSAAPLGPNGEVRLFNLLYGNAGSIQGILQIAATANHPVSGQPSWLKNPLLTDLSYPGGFGTNPGSPFLLTAVGGLYVQPGAGQFVLGLPALVPPATADQIRLVFQAGGVADPATELNVRTLDIRPRASVTLPAAGPDNPANASLTIVPSTGGFSGRIRPGARDEPYQGLIIRDGDGKLRGYGQFNLPQLPLGPSSPRLSGGVVLEEVPPLP